MNSKQKLGSMALGMAILLVEMAVGLVFSPPSIPERLKQAGMGNIS